MAEDIDEEASAAGKAFRPWQLIFVVVFFLMLIAPAIQMKFAPFSIPPLDENRVRARWPHLSMLRDPGVFISRCQSWFDDHYGFRDLLIRLKTQIDYSIFKASDRIYIGKDGWLFYRSVIDTEQPREEAMSDADLQSVIRNIEALRDFLAMRGIKMILITNQLKDKFYPDKLPVTARIAKTYHRFDDFRRLASAIPDIIYIDTTPVLEQVKLTRPIFYKTDFHWNNPAAFEISRRLVDDIAAAEGRSEHLWHYTFKTETFHVSGGQALFMPLFDPPSEEAQRIVKTWSTAPLSVDHDEGPFELVTRSHGEPKSMLPPTVVYADSFIDAMLETDVNDYFSEFYRARRNKTSLASVLAVLPSNTKYFVFQFIDVALPMFVDLPLH